MSQEELGYEEGQQLQLAEDDEDIILFDRQPQELTLKSEKKLE